MKAVLIGESAGATMDAIMKVYPRHKIIVDKYVARNEVIGIGPFTDMGNMGIFKTRAAAEQFAAEDPFILEGLIKSFVIRDWNDTLIRAYAADKSYSAVVEVNKSVSEVFRCITHDVPSWWGGKDFSGAATKLNDEFVINHPGAHYSRQKLIEVIPDRRVVWLVGESKLDWLKNPAEWTNTKMIFELTNTGYSTVLHFTHDGLVPETESYDRCSEGWTLVIKEWLRDYIVNATPHFML